MKLKKIFAKILVIVSLFWLGACESNLSPTVPEIVSSATPTQSEEQEMENSVDSYPYPVPIPDENQYSQSYPAPVLISPKQVQDNLLIAPDNAPIPQEGMGSISGLLYSYTTQQIIPETAYYLTPAVGEEKNLVPPVLVGPLAENGDVNAFSDQKGAIGLDNIPPGNYYLVVWAPYSWSVAEVSDTDPTPRLITIKIGERFPLGVIYLSWP